MAPHTRTRTGCWTCREAGYKCDEQKPHCGRCIRLKIRCKGYGMKLKWKDAVTSSTQKTRAREGARSLDRAAFASSPISTESVVSAPAVMNARASGSSQNWYDDGALVSFAPPVLAPDLPATDRNLLHYWVDHLSSLISAVPHNGRGSPFQLHLTSMACLPGALRSTVLSMSATHLALMSNDPHLRFQSFKHQRDAIHSLQGLIADSVETAFEPALATILMMQVSARLFGEEDTEGQAANHLIGAKAVIAQRGTVSVGQTSSTRFLLSLFAYHDILASVSRSSRPLVEHTVDFDGIEDDPTLQGIAQILQIVGRISELQVLAKEIGGDSKASIIFQTQAADVEAALLCARSLSFSETESIYSGSDDGRLTAEAYRHAAFIYLYRVWRSIGAPNPTTLHHVHQCLFYLEAIDVSSPLVSAHIWPLWTAGCEAIDSQQREFVNTRFRAMYQTRMFPSLRRITRDIEDVWAAKDTEMSKGGETSMAKVECISVIRKRRRREVDLV